VPTIWQLSYLSVIDSQVDVTCKDFKSNNVIPLPISQWKNYFLTNKKLDSSNGHLEKLKGSSNHLIPFMKSFEEISKKDGIAFLILDPSETHLQILHHGAVIGSNWNLPTKQAVVVIGTGPQAKLIQIDKKSTKNIKEKSFSSFSFEDFTTSLEDEETFTSLKNF